MLQETFIQLLKKYSADKKRIVELWNEIESNYSNKKRHYHTLSHLENLSQQLLPVKSLIKNWDTVLFSLYYHDVIYNPLKTTNEEKSAAFATNRLRSISVSDKIIKDCVYQILATKKHTACENADVNYFTDADLSILGQPWDEYEVYYKNVRKEYCLYPDLIYIPGRKKVLQHFLQMGRIFKTDFFFDGY